MTRLLSNLEAEAEGRGSPPRLLVMYWPCGVVPYLFTPQGEGTTYEASRYLAPFETAGLREQLSVFYGLRDALTGPGAGGSEGGVVMRMTGVNIPGTRANGGEWDDAVAGGPSFDQIFQRRIAALQTGYGSPVNAICDARVDSHETSSQCLSYSYETREVQSAREEIGLITEHVPLMPEGSPAKLYAQLFSAYMPGGGDSADLYQALTLRKSVLDYSLGELARLGKLAPASARPTLDAHADAIRKVEQELSEQLAQPLPRCALPPPPDALLAAKVGSKFDYGNEKVAVADSDSVAELGRLHLGVIRAAFQCDITRVATFQWSSAVDKVAFQGLFPRDPDGAYLHHPMSHRVSIPPTVPPGAGSFESDVFEFLGNVGTWYNQRTAEALAELKATKDVFGNPLLDHTIVPYVTDTANFSHMRDPLPALIFGGRALGMRGGFYSKLSPSRTFNDVWFTLAQAYLGGGVDVKQALAEEKFMLQQGSQLALLPGLWEAPV